MNDAPADVGIENNPRQRDGADQGRRASRVRHGGVPGPQLEREVQLLGRLFDGGHRQQRRGRPPTRSTGVTMRSGNMLYYPVPGVMTGVELQWGDRENFRTASAPTIFAIQFSVKYNFSKTF